MLQDTVAARLYSGIVCTKSRGATAVPQRSDTLQQKIHLQTGGAICSPKDERTSVVQFRTAAGESSATSVWWSEAALFKHLQARCPMGWSCLTRHEEGPRS